MATGFLDLIRVATADLLKVGPKGYIHGWIHVGVPDVGDHVFHPRHGNGKVSHLDDHGHVHVRFESGKTRSFAHGTGTGHGLSRRTGNDTFTTHIRAAAAANRRGDHTAAAEHYRKAADATDHPKIKAEMLARADRDQKKTTSADVEAQVRRAYSDAARQPGDWVPLAEVRDRLPGVPRADVDAALGSLAMKPDAHVIPWDNRKALTDRDHAAAFRFGGDNNHAIRIEPSPKPQSKFDEHLAAARAARDSGDIPAAIGHYQNAGIHAPDRRMQAVAVRERAAIDGTIKPKTLTADEHDAEAARHNQAATDLEAKAKALPAGVGGANGAGQRHRAEAAIAADARAHRQEASRHTAAALALRGAGKPATGTPKPVAEGKPFGGEGLRNHRMLAAQRKHDAAIARTNGDHALADRLDAEGAEHQRHADTLATAGEAAAAVHGRSERTTLSRVRPGDDIHVAPGVSGLMATSKDSPGILARVTSVERHGDGLIRIGTDRGALNPYSRPTGKVNRHAGGADHSAVDRTPDRPKTGEAEPLPASGHPLAEAFAHDRAAEEHESKAALAVEATMDLQRRSSVAPKDLKAVREADQKLAGHRRDAAAARAASAAIRANAMNPDDRKSLRDLLTEARTAASEGRHDDAARLFQTRADRLNAGDSLRQVNRYSTGGKRWSTTSAGTTDNGDSFATRREAEKWRSDADKSTAGLMQGEADKHRALAAAKSAEVVKPEDVTPPVTAKPTGYHDLIGVYNAPGGSYADRQQAVKDRIGQMSDAEIKEATANGRKFGQYSGPAHSNTKQWLRDEAKRRGIPATKPKEVVPPGRVDATTGRYTGSHGANRITAGRIAPGDKIHIETGKDGKLVPTTRTRTDVATVHHIEPVQRGQRTGYIIHTDKGPTEAQASHASFTYHSLAKPGEAHPGPKFDDSGIQTAGPGGLRGGAANLEAGRKALAAGQHDDAHAHFRAARGAAADDATRAVVDTEMRNAITARHADEDARRVADEASRKVPTSKFDEHLAAADQALAAGNHAEAINHLHDASDAGKEPGQQDAAGAKLRTAFAGAPPAEILSGGKPERVRVSQVKPGDVIRVNAPSPSGRISLADGEQGIPVKVISVGGSSRLYPVLETSHGRIPVTAQNVVTRYSPGSGSPTSKVDEHLAAADQALKDGDRAKAINHLMVAAGHEKDAKARKAITERQTALAAEMMGKKPVPTEALSATGKPVQRGDVGYYSSTGRIGRYQTDWTVQRVNPRTGTVEAVSAQSGSGRQVSRTFPAAHFRHRDDGSPAGGAGKKPSGGAATVKPARDPKMRNGEEVRWHGKTDSEMRAHEAQQAVAKATADRAALKTKIDQGLPAEDAVSLDTGRNSAIDARKATDKIVNDLGKSGITPSDAEIANLRSLAADHQKALYQADRTADRREAMLNRAQAANEGIRAHPENGDIYRDLGTATLSNERGLESQHARQIADANRLGELVKKAAVDIHTAHGKRKSTAAIKLPAAVDDVEAPDRNSNLAQAERLIKSNGITPETKEAAQAYHRAAHAFDLADTRHKNLSRIEVRNDSEIHRLERAGGNHPSSPVRDQLVAAYGNKGKSGAEQARRDAETAKKAGVDALATYVAAHRAHQADAKTAEAARIAAQPKPKTYQVIDHGGAMRGWSVLNENGDTVASGTGGHSIAHQTLQALRTGTAIPADAHYHPAHTGPRPPR